MAGDGSGDLYVIASGVLIPSTGTHPVFFLDQSDFTKPDYVSGNVSLLLSGR
jgi:hypothetical protein